MKFIILTVLLYLGKLSLIQAQQDPFFTKYFKRFTLECCLERHSNREEFLDKYWDYDEVISKCSRDLKKSTEYEVESAQKKIQEDQSQEKKPYWETTVTVNIICEHMNKFATCIQPVEDLLAKCKKTDGFAFIKLAKEACKFGGKRIIDFIKAGGDSCFSESRKMRDTFQPCLDRKFNSITNETEKYVARHTCKATSDLRECGQELIDNCGNSKAKQLFDSSLSEVQKDITIKQCFFQDSKIGVRTTTKRPSNPKIWAGPSKKIKHSRPKYVW